MITSYQGGGGGGGGGGRISNGSGFCYYFEKAHFVMFSGLLGSFSIKLLYYTAYFFKICTSFATTIVVCFA